MLKSYETTTNFLLFLQLCNADVIINTYICICRNNTVNILLLYPEEFQTISRVENDNHLYPFIIDLCCIEKPSGTCSLHGNRWKQGICVGYR